MILPSYLLTRPEIDDSQATTDSFDQLFERQVSSATGESIDYSLAVPKWQFLNYLCDSKEVVVHGSGKPDIEVFEPRKSNDSTKFGDQQAVYASSDGIWASYYAILDRDRYVRSLVNTCQKIDLPDGEFETVYYFSINDDALPTKPWRNGTIYILPRSSFENESGAPGRTSAQWRSFDPVRPLAKISLGPQDFPFLEQIRGHDVETAMKRSQEDPDGFPWIDD
jgi:hypothetical protein